MQLRENKSEMIREIISLPWLFLEESQEDHSPLPVRQSFSSHIWQAAGSVSQSTSEAQSMSKVHMGIWLEVLIETCIRLQNDRFFLVRYFQGQRGCVMKKESSWLHGVLVFLTFALYVRLMFL